MSNSQTTTIQTTVGPAAAQVSFAGPNVQVNVFMPPNGGAGFFLVFPASRRTQAIDAARRLAEGAPLAENINITDQVSGARAPAATIPTSPRRRVCPCSPRRKVAAAMRWRRWMRTPARHSRPCRSSRPRA